MVTTQPPLLEELQAIVGQDHAHLPEPSTRRFVINEIAPSIVVVPGTYEEIASVVRLANHRRLAVIPQVHGNVTWIGNSPSRYDIALSLARLNAIVEYEPADLTVTCQAGCTAYELGDPLRKAGQTIPFSKQAASDCVGPLLALPRQGSNLTWGSARDFTIGLRVVTADGRIIRTGGNVVKNVAGYDLTKLFIGSMGTLGIIVEATFKLAPKPQVEDHLFFEFDSVGSASTFAWELRKRGLAISEIELKRSMSITEAGPVPRGHVRLTIHLGGTAGTVGRSRREATALALSTGGTAGITPSPKREDPLPEWAANHPLTNEISVLPTRLSKLIDEVDREAPGAFLEGSPLTGVISLTWLSAGPDEDRVRRVRTIATRLAGTLVVTGCDPELKRKIDVFGEVPPKTLELMRHVKQQFDPNGILSPGRFVGRL